jgi:hypothetical protein
MTRGRESSESVPPHVCRVQAQLYADLANAAKLVEDKEHFASLADGWARLAAEIEDALGLRTSLEQIDVAEPNYFEYSDAA